MKHLLWAAMSLFIISACQNEPQTISGGDARITFVGRTDHSTPEAPRQWAAGAYFTFGFEGTSCIIDINDENIYGNGRNIIEVVVDDMPTQSFFTHGVRNRIVIGSPYHDTNDTTIHIMSFDANITNQKHHVCICRNTETAMGYTQLTSVSANKIFKWTPQTNLKIEFIGNSITCGAEADTTAVSATEYKWGDWHRAYYGYGPCTARNINAQWALTSVSGIGLIHSCCNMDITMPQVYDKYILRENKLNYDFTDFEPDIICSCLGQNDGIQDSATFCSAYVDFIKDVVCKNKQVKHIVLLSSPMDHAELDAWLRTMLTAVADKLKADGINIVSTFFFSQAWNAGGASHPNCSEHAQIANELTEYLKTIL